MRSETCNHVWQPMADSVRIWQRCLKCEAEEHVTTHRDQLMSTLAYVFRDDQETPDAAE